MRLASSHESAGDSDQMIESAVNTASAAKPEQRQRRRTDGRLSRRVSSAAATSAAPQQDQPDLGPGRALEPQPAVGGERDGGEHDRRRASVSPCPALTRGSGEAPRPRARPRG